MHTDNDTVTDSVVRDFAAVLPPAARRRLELNDTTIPLIHAALKHHTVNELAVLVGTGIGWRTPLNGHALMRYRLSRAAGHNDDSEGDIA